MAPAVNRKVIDISHYNAVTSWAAVKAAGIVGVIHKATEGTSSIDDHYLRAKPAALAAGLLWGAYHFANGNDVNAQVDNFLRVVGIDDKTLYALDWEDEPHGNTMSRAQAQQFLTLVDQRTGRKGALYSGNTAKEALGNEADPFFGSHRLWLAQYGLNPVPQASWSKFWLWQYSDGRVGPQPHGCPGVSGDVDTNSWQDTDQALIDQWAGWTTPIPVQVPIVSMTLSADKPVRIKVHGGDNIVKIETD